MGKKATILLSWFLYAIQTYVMAGLAVVAWFAGTVPPHQSWFVAFMALGLTPILIINLINLLVWLFKRSWRLLIPVLAIALNYDYLSAIYQLPFSFNDRHDAVKEADFRIGSYNMHGHYQKDLNGTLKDILNYFEAQRADIVCFQEFCKRPDTNIDGANSHYPYYVVLAENVGMQLAVFSKYPITNARLMDFKGSINSGMVAEIDFPHKKVALVNVHFQTTNLNQSHNEIEVLKVYGINSLDGKEAFDAIMQRLSNNATVRSQQVEETCRTIGLQRQQMPVVVCGDFNDTPASYAYHQVKKNMIDGFQTCGKGYCYTFNQLFKLFRLDYIMYSEEFRAVDYFSEQRPWSDHNPVLLTLDYTGGSLK